MEIRRASNRASTPSPGVLDGPPVKWQYPGLAWNVRDGFLLGSEYQPKRATDLSTETPLTEGPGYEVISITPLSPGISRIVLRAPSTASSAFLRLAKP